MRLDLISVRLGSVRLLKEKRTESDGMDGNPSLFRLQWRPTRKRSESDGVGRSRTESSINFRS